MVDYLKRHEALVERVLASEGQDFDWGAFARHHRSQIGYLQHERLIHLLVTLFVGLVGLLTFLVFVNRPGAAMAALVLLFLVLLIPYVLHYFRLENGVQRLYDLGNELDRRAGLAPALRADDPATGS